MERCTVLENRRISLPMFTMYRVTTATRIQGASGKLEVETLSTRLSCWMSRKTRQDRRTWVRGGRERKMEGGEGGGE